MPEQFPAPSPIDVVHQSDTPILPLLETAGVELTPVDTAEHSDSEREGVFEDRLSGLMEEINKLHDTTSREIIIDPTTGRTIKLSDLAKMGKGWKLHLNFDADNPRTVAEISRVLEKLKERTAITTFKIGSGGGKKAGADGKESTVYIGDKNKALTVATFLEGELASLLDAPEGDTLTDDILLAPNIMGRFEVGQVDPEFHQYGGPGFPVLLKEFSLIITEKDPIKRRELVRQKQIASLAYLEQKYGDYFTGTQEETLPVEGEVVIPRYDSANQVSVADLDDLYPDWREDHEGSDPELVLLWAIRRQESTRIADALQVSAESATGEGLERAVDQIPFDVGTHFDAHGIAGKFGMPSDELDALLKNGIDENRTFYSKSLDYSPEASGALGADRPFTEGDLIVVSGMDEMLVDGGIKYVLVGETYLKCFDLLRNRYPEVTFIPWHEAPDFFVDMVNGAENTKFVKNKIEYPNTFAIIPDAPSLNYPVSKDESPVIINKDMPTDRDDVW